MAWTRMLRVAFPLSCLVPSAMAAQVPPELREAMRARDEAVLAQFKTQQATPPAPAQQEQIKHYGDVFVRRALRQVRDAGAAWVLDIWVKDAKGWRVAAVQVTSAKK